MRKTARPYAQPYSDKETVLAWVNAQISAERPFLLAHAYDGVIWGLRTNDGLKTSHDIAPDISPPLRNTTLLNLSLFGEGDEIRLFRDDFGRWQTVQIVDPEADAILDEYQMLIGDALREQDNVAFTHLYDKVQQGLDHIVPLPITQDELDNNHSAALKVYHHMQQDDETGEVIIVESRLVSVTKIDHSGEEVQT